MGQQRLLVLDALGFRLMLIFILLTQACIDCTKDLLHLLVSALLEFLCKPGSDNLVNYFVTSFKRWRVGFV